MRSRRRKQRFHNLRRIERYIERVGQGGRFRIFSPVLNARQQLGEEIYLGLRRTVGIALRPEHREAFGGIIERQIADGLLQTMAGDGIALTRRGMEIANTVFFEYV